MRLKNFLLVSCGLVFCAPLPVMAQDATPTTKTEAAAVDASKFIGVFRGTRSYDREAVTLILNSMDGTNFTGYAIELSWEYSLVWPLKAELADNKLTGIISTGATLFGDGVQPFEITAQGDQLTYKNLKYNFKSCVLTNQSDELYSKIPFDETQKQLPANFKGHNIVNLFDAIQKSPRDEFETANDYYARIATEMGMKGKWDAESLFAAYINIDPNSASIKYDIDAKTMRISLSWPSDGIQWGSKLGKRNTSSRFNPYDAIDYKLALKNIRNEINMSLTNFEPKDAQSIKPDLDILVVFQLAAPATTYQTLQVKVKKFVWFDSKTGEIVGEFVQK